MDATILIFIAKQYIFMTEYSFSSVRFLQICDSILKKNNKTFE